MHTKVLIGVLVALLAAAGWVIYLDNQRQLADEQMNERATPSAAVSFICADNSYFIAEFPEAFDRVSIIVDGEVVRTLPRVDGDGQRFEDTQYVYVFAGEEVTVTNKADGSQTVCDQPFDPNNAPYNFGDAGEGAGDRQDAVDATRANIVGVWRSMDDASFTRTFSANGTVLDEYDDAVTSTGSWEMFVDTTAPDVAFTLEPDTVYLRIMDDTEAFHYTVSKLTPEELELIYMERGGALRFTRVE
ncbi:MAG: hypothetical protein WDZ93_01830 [Candidatus Paceibacterota bacterium]